MATVSLRHIYRKFNDVTAVNDVNIDIADKEFLVLVGPSGCGKSTTLRLIAGLEEISGGEIYIGERLVNDVPPKDRDIAMVFQSYALYPHMNVYDNIAFNLRLSRLGKSEIDARVQEAARILRLGELLARSPAQLSGGQRQRVAIGRAIVRNPKVFLFDEPLSNLDAALRVQMRLEIERLHRELGTTMIYVTHDQVEAMTLADRIVALDKGVIQQVGPPLELYARPRNLFVAGFIGSPKMNLLPGRVLSASAGRAVVGLYADAGARLDLALPAATAGDPVTVGVRPEALEIVGSGAMPSSRTALAAKVESIERLGNITFVYLDCGASELVTVQVMGQSALVPGQTVQIGLHPAQLHIFDAAGTAIAAAASA